MWAAPGSLGPARPGPLGPERWRWKCPRRGRGQRGGTLLRRDAPRLPPASRQTGRRRSVPLSPSQSPSLSRTHFPSKWPRGAQTRRLGSAGPLFTWVSVFSELFPGARRSRGGGRRERVGSGDAAAARAGAPGAARAVLTTRPGAPPRAPAPGGGDPGVPPAAGARAAGTSPALCRGSGA